MLSALFHGLRPIAIVAILLVVPLEAQRIGTPEPEPFRRDDQLSGRDFDYEEESFIHRFSYRFRPEAVRRWLETSEGFRGTWGSVRSDELYAFQELRKTIPLDDPYYFVFRHRLDEDFDGRYDRTLTGAGMRWGRGIHATILGEIVGEKEDIDAQFELAYTGEWGGIRGAFLPVDFMLDSKSDGLKYGHEPYTAYFEGLWRSGDGLELSGWANLNPHTQLTDELEDFAFSSDQYAVEGNIRLSLDDSWRAWLSVGGETGERDRRNVDPNSPLEQRFTRKHFQCTLQLEREVTPGLSFWFGTRYFRLMERDRRPGDPTLDGELRFRESMLYGGVAYRVHERILIWPSLYLEHVDDVEDYPLGPALNESKKGFVGKVTLPVEIHLGRGATITMNLGMFLHEARFGGGNIQVQFPF